MGIILLNIELPWQFDPDRTERIPCLICGDTGDKIGTIIANDIELGINKCPHDTLMWISPRPDQSFYDQMYTNHFFNSTCSEQYGYSTIDEEDRRKEKAELNWRDIEIHSPVDFKYDSFLEIGCATGEMLDRAASREWKEIYGNEISPLAVKRCKEKGFNMYPGDYSSISQKSCFELIFADNVIEHLPDPMDFLNRMSGLLKETGLLCLRLPNTPYSGPTLKLIDHTFHFNPVSLNALLQKCNLQMIKQIDSGLYQGSENRSILNMTVFCVKR